MSKIVGHISQVIGPVVDVRFKFDGVDAEHALPKIHDAMTIKRHDGRILVVEVQQHIGEDTVRTVRWTVQTGCSAEWKSCLPDRLLQCLLVLKIKDE